MERMASEVDKPKSACQSMNVVRTVHVQVNAAPTPTITQDKSEARREESPILCDRPKLREHFLV
jgi:hypothetical protein